MDSGTANSAAHIGRECVAHRTSSRPPLVVWQSTTVAHFGGASALNFHCQSRRVGISGFHCGGELCCLAPCAQHDAIMRAYHARTDNALVNRVSTQHLDTVRELLNLLDEALAETQHARRNMCDGKELPAPHADASFPLRPGRGPHHCGWRWWRRTPAHSAAHASSDDHHLSVLVRD